MKRRCFSLKSIANNIFLRQIRLFNQFKNYLKWSYSFFLHSSVVNVTSPLKESLK